MTIGRRRRALGFILLAALALTVLGALPTTSPAAQAQTGSGQWRPGEVQAARALLAHVPAEFRVDCTLREVFELIPVPAGVVARVDCRPRGLGVDTVTYQQFGSTDSAQAYYQDAVRGAGPNDLAGCTGDAPYSVNGAPAGRVACVANPKLLGAEILYTYEPLRVVGEINKFQDDAGNVDLQALYDFSNKHAGPDASAGTIPSLLTAAQERKAADALRGHLPTALRNKCTAESVIATPWVAASLNCSDHPAPGVRSASFTQYRTQDAFTFDPEAFAARSEASNATCPDSGTWSSAKGQVLGRYACTYSKVAQTALYWTLDRARILAEAGSDYGAPSKQLLTWWDQKGNLTP
jgi:hypothetical protein